MSAHFNSRKVGLSSCLMIRSCNEKNLLVTYIFPTIPIKPSPVVTSLPIALLDQGVLLRQESQERHSMTLGIALPVKVVVMSLVLCPELKPSLKVIMTVQTISNYEIWARLASLDVVTGSHDVMTFGYFTALPKSISVCN